MNQICNRFGPGDDPARERVRQADMSIHQKACHEMSMPSDSHYNSRTITWLEWDFIPCFVDSIGEVERREDRCNDDEDVILAQVTSRADSGRG